MKTKKHARLVLYSVLILAIGFLSINIFPNVVFAQTVSISPTSGGVGITVNITGSGFPVNTAFTVKIAGNSVGTGTTSASGTITKSITVPTTLPSGTTVINVTAGTKSVDSNFEVLPPSVSLSVQQGVAGTPVTVTGHHFPPGANYSISFDSTSVSSGTIDSSGNISASINVPSNSTPGNKTITITAGSLTADSSFTIPSPIIAVSPQEGGIGTSITVTGQYFPAGKSFSATFESTNFSSGTTDSSGSINFSVKVPSVSSPGTKTITVTVEGLSATNQFNVLPPVITISPQEGGIGTSITVTGQYFPPKSKCSLVFGNTSLSSGTIDDNGQISLNAVIPTGNVPGKKTLALTAGSFSANQTFEILPGSISLSSTEGIVGSTVKIIGQGFNYSQQINILLDGRQLGSVTSSTTGAFSGSFVITPASAGTHNISAQDAYFNIAIGQSFKILPNLSYKSPDQITVGSSVTLSGTGFASNSSVVLTVKDVPSREQRVQTDNYGSFPETSFKLPATTGGLKNIMAQDSSGNETILGSSLMIKPTTETIGSASGPFDAPLTIRGTGFSAGDNNLSVFLSDVQLGIAQSDSYGSLEFKGKVPEMPSGTFDIVVRDTHGNSTSNTKFTVEPLITSDLTEGCVGEQVKLSGKGFLSGTPISLFWDGTSIPPDNKIETNIKGSFTGTFTVPKSNHGGHSWSVSDGKNTAASSWIMENTPPPAPVLNGPPNSERIGHLWSQTPTFVWSKVSDPSGVTYQLDVSSDLGFKNVTFTKNSIPDNFYTLSKGETLGKGNYYWRIRAIDGAGNASQWSDAYSIQIGSNLPIWLGVGLLIILASAAIVFRLRIGYTKKQRESVRKINEKNIIKKQENKKAEKKRQEEIDALKRKIYELAREHEYNGRLKLSTITSRLQIDEKTARICLKELRAKLTHDLYTFDEILKLHQK